MTVTPDGHSLRAFVAPHEACSVVPGDAGRLVTRMQQTVPFARVQVLIGGSNQSLKSYVRSSCRQLALPGGNGRIVLTDSGFGFKQTQSFTVRARRWSIEYVNNGSLLQVFPFRGKQLNIAAFSVSARGAGRRIVGGPGRYSLRVGGAGSWIVRVRDGG